MSRLAPTSVTTEVWGHLRVLIGGADYTRYEVDGVEREAIVNRTTLASPGTDISASITLPGFDVHTDEIGTGVWAGVADRAEVRIEHINAAGAVQRLVFWGYVQATRASSTGLDVACDGEWRRFSQRLIPLQTGRVEASTVGAACSGLVASFVPPIPGGLTVTGSLAAEAVSYRGDGSTTYEQALVDILSQGLGNAGQAPTIVRDDDGHFVLQNQGTGAKIWTVTHGQPGVEVDLTIDYTTRADVIYGQGVNERGGKWRGMQFPALSVDDTIPWPVAAGAVYTAGDVLPASVGEPLWDLCRTLNYVVANDGEDIYLVDDVPRIRDLRMRSGLDADAIIDKDLWERCFTAPLAGHSQAPVRLPIYQRKWCDPWIRNVFGAVIGVNPDHDPTRTPVDAAVDFGDGINIHVGRLAAMQMLAREAQPLLSGTIRLTGDPREGFRGDIEPDDIIRVEHFRGRPYVDLRGSQVEIDWQAAPLSVTLQVSDRSGTYVTIADEKKRKREISQSRRGGALPSVGPGVEWDADSPAGRIPKRPLQAHVGRSIRVPVPQSGTIVKSRIVCSQPTEFIAAVFDRPTTAADVEAVIGGNPLDLDKADPTRPHKKVLREELGLKAWWGSKPSPCGYSEETKAQGDEDDADLTGEFVEEDGWTYAVEENGDTLRCIIWAAEDCDVTGRFWAGADW